MAGGTYDLTFFVHSNKTFIVDVKALYTVKKVRGIRWSVAAWSVVGQWSPASD